MPGDLERTIGEMVSKGRETIFSAIRQKTDPIEIRQFTRAYSHSRDCGYALVTERDSSSKLNRLRYTYTLIAALLRIDQSREAYFSPEARESWIYALDPFKQLLDFASGGMEQASHWKYISKRVEEGEITTEEAWGALKDHLRVAILEYKRLQELTKEHAPENFDYWHERLTEATEVLAAIHRRDLETIRYRSVKLKTVNRAIN